MFFKALTLLYITLLIPLSLKAQVPKTLTSLTPTSGAINWNAATSTSWQVTATGNITINNPSNISSGIGQTYIFSIKRDGLSYHTVEWGSLFKFKKKNKFKASGKSTRINIAMTNDSSPPYTATCSSHFGSGYRCHDAFNNNNSTSTDSWISSNGSGNTFPQTVQINLGSVHSIDKYEIKGSMVQGNGNDTVKDWTFEGSNDGTSWTVLDTQSGQSNWASGELRPFPLTGVASYQYFRLNISDNNGSNSYTGIAELYLYQVPSLNSTSDFIFLNRGTHLIEIGSTTYTP